MPSDVDADRAGSGSLPTGGRARHCPACGHRFDIDPDRGPDCPECGVDSHPARDCWQWDCEDGPGLAAALADAGVLPPRRAEALVRVGVLGQSRRVAAAQMGVSASAVDDHRLAAKADLRALYATVRLLEPHRDRLADRLDLSLEFPERDGTAGDRAATDDGGPP